MGFFNNMKYFKDRVTEYDSVKNIEQLQGVFDAIDGMAEDEREKNKREREYFESLSADEKVEYKREQRKKENKKRLAIYAMAAVGTAGGAGLPVLMAANVGRILADDSWAFDQDKHDYQVEKLNRKSKGNSKRLPKPRKYFKINYTDEGIPKVSTLVDKDPYDLDERYELLMRE